jgi:hypothetical protein
MTLLLLIAGLLGAAPASGLRARTVPTAVRVPSNLIVGRAVCGGTTWFLTDFPELIAVSHAALNPVVTPVRGLRFDDHPWGLACLADGSLWTLPTSTTLARLGPDATVRERRTQRLPRIALFGWANRLLQIELPVMIGKPLFATTSGNAADSQSWPGLIARSADSRAALLARNLASCGIARGINLPCWFADDRRAVVSDGVNSYAVSFLALTAGDVEPEAPIWDIAFQHDDAFWLLVATKGAARAHKAGGRLVSADKKGAAVSALQLPVPVRSIVAASDKRCVLLAVDGTLVEVVGQ